jgi:hypothetical protein
MLEPSGSSQAVIESTADPQHQQQRGGMAEGLLHLQHVFEIHNKNARYRGRYGEDRGPADQLLDDVAYQSKTLILCAGTPCPWRALPRPERLGLTMK